MANQTSNSPRLRTLEPTDGERHASWLELFFDLVFVLAVAEIAKILAGNSDIYGTIKFIALFVPVWWSWVGFTFYADRFETEETTYRLLMFAGMFAIAVLALSLKNAFSIDGDLSFVVCYILVRLVLIALYARSAYYVPLARDLSLRFLYGFSIAAGFWLISLVVPPPFRYAIWAITVIIELITPVIHSQSVKAIPIDLSHIPERFGLFTIIVLGEVVVATANGVSNTAWNFPTLIAAFFGFAMAVAIWWINFDFVGDGAIKSDSVIPRFIYLYGHFFIVASIVAIGIGVEHAIMEIGKSETHLHSPTLALIGGGIAVYLSTITVIKLAAENCSLLYGRLTAIAVSLLFIYIGYFLPPIAVIVVFLFILGIGVWLEDRFGNEISSEHNPSHLTPCEHAGEMQIYKPRSEDGCEECVKNNYKWVHLRLCLSCGHVGCCDSSIYKHATKHFHEDDHPVIASLEAEENWAWCYKDERYVPLLETIEEQRENQKFRKI